MRAKLSYNEISPSMRPRTSLSLTYLAWRATRVAWNSHIPYNSPSIPVLHPPILATGVGGRAEGGSRDGRHQNPMSGREYTMIRYCSVYVRVRDRDRPSSSTTLRNA